MDVTVWIRMLSDEEADEDLREALDFARSPHGTMDNVMRVHSLRPNTLRGHVILYRAALHDDSNTLPTWLQECIASYVSILNDCPYSLANHWANARHLIGDDERAAVVEAALRARRPADAFEGRELALLRYAEKLTLRPGAMEAKDARALFEAGLEEGKILEANQIIGYFNYVNRCHMGSPLTLWGEGAGGTGPVGLDSHP